MNILESLKILCQAGSPSGYEYAVASVVASGVQACVDLVARLANTKLEKEC